MLGPHVSSDFAGARTIILVYIDLIESDLNGFHIQKHWNWSNGFDSIQMFKRVPIIKGKIMRLSKICCLHLFIRALFMKLVPKLIFRNHNTQCCNVNNSIAHSIVGYTIQNGTIALDNFNYGEKKPLHKGMGHAPFTNTPIAYAHWPF